MAWQCRADVLIGAPRSITLAVTRDTPSVQVYLLSIPASAASLTAMVPKVYYTGVFPTTPLVDGQHGGFSVTVALHLWSVD